jgi:hypothetical protein
MRMMDPRLQQKKTSSRWMIVFVDVWFLFGFILGKYTPNSVVFLVICVVAVFLIITHVILSWK